MSATRVHVVPNGVDESLFDPATATPAQVRETYRLQGRFVVGWVGVLRNWHGLELLLEAVRDIPEALVLVVGDGPDRAAVEGLAAATGLSTRLVVTGRVPHARMPDYIAAMDVAVVADDRTGVASPMKLLEYMAMGRAVVAPALDNIRDLVTDGESGLLFAPGDASALRARLRELLNEPSLRTALGSAARESILTSRTWRAVAGEVLAQAGS